jgi:ABC-2 type transport system ATP-binding protein
MSVVLDRLTIRYGDRVAVADLSVEFPSGAVGLLGRNGAGKSSILKALLGLVQPSSGTMRIGDLPAGLAAAELQRHIGYMPERDAHLAACSGFEMVALLGRLGGLRRRDAWRRAHEVLYLVGLGEQRYRQVSGYSAGMRQKVKLAAALVHDPALLFLDEPTNGLDPAGRDDMLALVRQLTQELGKSVLLSTHILPDVEQVCSAAVVLEAGRVVARGSIAELTGGAPRRWLLAVDGGPASVETLLAGVAEVVPARPGVVEVALRPGSRPEQLFERLRAGGAVVRSFVPQRRSLEEVFLAAVRASAEPSTSQDPGAPPRGVAEVGR